MSGLTEAQEGSPRERARAAVAPVRPSSRAYSQARRHSALVRWLRRAIPALAAVAAASVAAAVFLDPFARMNAEVTLGPVSVSGTKVVMENPRLTGYRKENRGYEVTASSAMQDVRKPTVIELTAMKGHLAVDDQGRLAHIEAAAGVFDTQKEHLDVTQDVRVWTDDGQAARLKSASVDFKAGTISSRDPVTVILTGGTVEADGVEVRENGKVISFIGRVRTVLEKGEAGAQGATVGATLAEAMPAAEPAAARLPSDERPDLRR